MQSEGDGGSEGDEAYQIGVNSAFKPGANEGQCMRSFVPDALLAALPRREIRLVQVASSPRRTAALPEQVAAIPGEKGEYNGLIKRERDRTARVSNWLALQGATKRAEACDICGAFAADEHAENYYDLTTWIGLCITCHRAMLHKRVARPEIWGDLLQSYEKPSEQWTRLVSPAPFDLASLLRSRGATEPVRSMFYYA